MKRLLIFSALAAACLACNNKSSTREVNDSTITIKDDAIVQQQFTCYRGNSGKDSVFMHLTENGNAITGTIEYRFFEKDRSSGNFTGEIKGDTLLVHYTYQSEGVVSSREITFLKQGDRVLEGDGFVLTKTDCN
jgi:hypothetical protein